MMKAGSTCLAVMKNKKYGAKIEKHYYQNALLLTMKQGGDSIMV